jgi:hypothetical protein
MTRRRPFKELTRDWPADLRLRVEKRKEELSLEIEQAALSELRKALHVSQARLAHSLGKSQAAVAQMEQRSDMKISTLRETIEAMGGRLELLARFPAGDVTITHLGEIAD